MKKLIRILTLGVMAMVFAIPAFAVLNSEHAIAVQDDKAALYKKITDNLTTNQPLAFEASKEYLQKYPDDDPAIIAYLKDFVAKYEKGSRKAAFTKHLVDKKWADAIAIGKQIAVDMPEDLWTNLNVAWAGYNLAFTGNNSFNNEAATFSTKAIQLIDSGKTLEAGKPFPEKDKYEYLGWLHYSLGLYNLKNNKNSEAASEFIKAASYDGPTKLHPITYAQLAAAYEADYSRLQEAYDVKYKGQTETEESKVALQQVKQFMEPMIDAYARAVAYSAENPAYQTIKTSAKQRLTELYKFAKGSETGIDELIVGVKAKPLPPQPNVNVSAAVAAPAPSATPAATPAATPTTTEATTTTGTTTPTTTTTKPPATTTPTKPQKAHVAKKSRRARRN